MPLVLLDLKAPRGMLSAYRVDTGIAESRVTCIRTIFQMPLR